MELEQMTLLKDMSLEYATWPSAMPEDISAEVLADVEKFGLKLAELTSFLDKGKAAPPVDVRGTYSWCNALKAQIEIMKRPPKKLKRSASGAEDRVREVETEMETQTCSQRQPELQQELEESQKVTAPIGCDVAWTAGLYVGAPATLWGAAMGAGRGFFTKGN